MKVLYITPGVFDKGGISRYGRYQIQALRDLLGASSVCVVSMAGPRPDQLERPFQVDWTSSATGVRAKVETSLAVLRLARQHRPDIIWSAHVNFSGLGQVAANLVRAVSVAQVYGSEIWGPRRWDATWGLRANHAVISDCHFTARYLEDHALRPKGTTAVMWDCVDVRRFAPGPPSRRVIERYGIPDPSHYINLLTLGRLSQSSACNKGYDRLLKVFSMLQNTSALHLLYAGQGDMIPELRAEATAMGLASRVHFLGSIHEDDLADVYRSAHVFSLVSHWSVGHGEGIPLTPLEAAACGVPIIVGNQDGSAEAVVRDENGFVIDPFDLPTHQDRISRLVNDADLRVRLGQAARRRIEKEHAYEVFRGRVQRFLRDLPAATEQHRRQALA